MVGAVDGKPGGQGDEGERGRVKGGQVRLVDHRAAQREGKCAEQTGDPAEKLATEAIDANGGQDGEAKADRASTLQATEVVTDRSQDGVETRCAGEVGAGVLVQEGALADVLDHAVAHEDVQTLVLEGSSTQARTHRQGDLAGPDER